MSVQMNQYLCFGFLLDYKAAKAALKQGRTGEEYDELLEAYYDSAFDAKIVEVNGCSMIEDGMDGKYCFFGKVFAKSKVYEPLDTVACPTPSRSTKQNVMAEAARVFGSELLGTKKPTALILTHYR